MDDHGRDLRIDILRGYFVFAMIVDHVRGWSPLYLLTGGNRFYTSAAEGFVFTSGLVSGLVYRRLIARDGMSPTLMKVVSRVGVLYLLTVALTLLLLPISELLALPWAQGVDLSDPLRVVVSILTLHRTYYLADVMLLYTCLFLVAPLTFVFLERGRTWPVLVGSWLLWGLFQFYPEYAALPWPIAGNYLFEFSAWQVLFFTGLVMGYRQERMPVLASRGTRIALVVTGLGSALLVVLYFIVDTPRSLMPDPSVIGTPVVHTVRDWMDEFLWAKVPVRPGRLITSAFVYSFMFLMMTVRWHSVRRWVGWLLLPLGQHALYAYTAHIALAALIAITLAPLRLVYPGPQWLNALIQVASLLVIWAMIRFQFLSPGPRTRRFYYASPAAIALLVVAGLLIWPVTPPYAELSAAPAAAAVEERRPSRFGTPIPREALQPPSAAAVAQVRAALPPVATLSALPPAGASPPATSSSLPAGGTPPLATPSALKQPGTELPNSAVPLPTVPLPQRTGTPAAGLALDPTPVPTPTLPWKVVNSADPQTRVAEFLDLLDGLLQERWFYSPELDRDMPYWAYTPPDYGTAGRRYPVLYMLHGRGGHRDEWIVYGLINVADREIHNGHLPPMIIILPQGDRDYWVNHTGDGPLWGEYVVRDLIPHIDGTYRTLRTPQARAIGGLSMGGWGALHHAFSRPDVFGVVGAHSASLRPDDGSLSFLGTGAEYAAKDPLNLAATAPSINRLRIWIDMPEKDPWLEYAALLHEVLDQRGVSHVWQVYPGDHIWTYWEEHAIDYLHFYGNSLARQ